MVDIVDRKVNAMYTLKVESTANGRKIAASQTLTAPIINGGQINGATINSATLNSGSVKGGSINIGNGNFIVDSVGNLTAKSGTFEGTVRADKIEGDVLKMYIMSNPSRGVYTVSLPAQPVETVVVIMGATYPGDTDSVKGGGSSLSDKTIKIYFNDSLKKTYSSSYSKTGSTHVVSGAGSYNISYFYAPPIVVTYTQTISAGVETVIRVEAPVLSNNPVVYVGRT